MAKFRTILASGAGAPRRAPCHHQDLSRVHREVFDDVVDAPEHRQFFVLGGPFLEERLRGERRQPLIDIRNGRPEIGQQAIRGQGFAPVELLLPDVSNRLPADWGTDPAAGVRPARTLVPGLPAGHFRTAVADVDQRLAALSAETLLEKRTSQRRRTDGALVRLPHRRTLLDAHGTDLDDDEGARRGAPAPDARIVRNLHLQRA